MKRRFFQIHLLTAVVGMLVAAGFLWANTRLHRAEYLMDLNIGGDEHVVLYPVVFTSRGWPLPVSHRLPNRSYYQRVQEYMFERGSVLSNGNFTIQKMDWVPTFSRSRIEGLRKTAAPAYGDLIQRKDLLTHDPTLERSIQPAPKDDDGADF